MRSLTDIQKQFSGRSGNIYFSWQDQIPKKLDGFVGLQLKFSAMSITIAPNRVILTDDAGHTMFIDDVKSIKVVDGIVPGSKYFTVVCESDKGDTALYHILADYDE